MNKQIDKFSKIGVLITSKKEPRKNWAQAIEKTITNNGPEAIDHDWLDIPLDYEKETEE